MKLTGFYNGDFLPVNDISLPVNDLLILRGLGVFDYLRTYNRKPFLAKEHIERFLSSARGMHLSHSLSSDYIFSVLEELADRSPLSDSGFRMILSPGMGTTSLTAGKPSFLVLTEELHPYDGHWYEIGIAAKTIPFLRYKPEFKSIMYAQAVIELTIAKEEGFQEILYDSGEGLTEGTTCNLFYVADSVLYASIPGSLPGTRMKFVMDLAADVIPVRSANLQLSDIAFIGECFVTSTTREILPVTKINGTVIGSGKPGPVTTALHKIYKDLVRSF